MALPEPSFLEALGEDRFAPLRRRGTVRRYPRGVALIHERQVPDSAIVLLAGRVKIVQVSAEGRELMLAVRGRGDLLGEQGAIDGEPRSASVIALDDVEALVVAAAEFLDFLGAEPEAALYVMRRLARRLRDADRKRVEFSAKDSMARVASRLVELADRFGESDGNLVRIELPLTQEELAGWAGASREAATKALQSLRQLGWIETSRRSVTIRDLDALRRRAA